MAQKLTLGRVLLSKAQELTLGRVLLSKAQELTLESGTPQYGAKTNLGVRSPQ